MEYQNLSFKAILDLKFLQTLKAIGLIYRKVLS